MLREWRIVRYGHGTIVKGEASTQEEWGSKQMEVWSHIGNSLGLRVLKLSKKKGSMLWSRDKGQT